MAYRSYAAARLTQAPGGELGSSAAKLCQSGGTLAAIRLIKLLEGRE